MIKYTRGKNPNSRNGFKKGYKTTEATRKKMSIAKSENPTRYWLGKHFPLEIREKLSEMKKGEKCYNWKGGISNNPYPKEFTPELKLKIRTRDNFICYLCGRTEREELEELDRVLCINHIDFNKNNCREENLNTLCLRCNVKINRERDYWVDYFKLYG